MSVQLFLYVSFMRFFIVSDFREIFLLFLFVQTKHDFSLWNIIECMCPDFQVSWKVEVKGGFPLL